MEDKKLWEAVCKNENMFQIQCLLGNLCNRSNYKNKEENNQSLLHVACKNANPSLVQMLIDKQANPNAIDDFGNTPIHYLMISFENNNINDEYIEACIYTRRVCLAFLMNENLFTNINFINNDGKTPLDLLMVHLKHLNDKTREDQIKEQILVPMISEYGARTCIELDISSNSNIWYAYKYLCSTESIRLALYNGADINVIGTIKQIPVLFQAVYDGKYKFSKTLLKQNARLDLVDNHGENVIFYAINKLLNSHDGENFKIVYTRLKFLKLLHKFGANFNLKNKDGFTVIEKVQGNSNLSLRMKMLLYNTLRSLGANPCHQE